MRRNYISTIRCAYDQILPSTTSNLPAHTQETPGPIPRESVIVSSSPAPAQKTSKEKSQQHPLNPLLTKISTPTLERAGWNLTAPSFRHRAGVRDGRAGYASPTKTPVGKMGGGGEGAWGLSVSERVVGRELRRLILGVGQV